MMPSDAPRVLTEFLEPPDRNFWATYRVNSSWFVVTVLLAVVICLGGHWFVCRAAPNWSVWALLANGLASILLTALGFSWAAVIALHDDARRGLLFSTFPPYTLWYIISRWSAVSQPMIVFLAGLTIFAGSAWLHQRYEALILP